MDSSSDLDDQIHALWDELADYGAAQTDEALDHLLYTLCRLVKAQNASWLGSVRMPDILPGDAIHGWRVMRFYCLNNPTAIIDATKAQIKELDKGQVDETTVRHIAMAGTFRTNRAEDLVPGFLDSEYAWRYLRSAGRADAMWSTVPINADTECHFGIFRAEGQPRFTPEERDLVGRVMRSLKWFCRRLMLSHGLAVACTPLTATERAVLGGLLSGQLEKEIAANLGQSYHTTHEHVANLFRKFNVKNRAALMALWLGQIGPTEKKAASPAPAASRARRSDAPADAPAALDAERVPERSREDWW